MAACAKYLGREIETCTRGAENCVCAVDRERKTVCRMRVGSEVITEYDETCPCPVCVHPNATLTKFNWRRLDGEQIKSVVKFIESIGQK